MKETLTQWQRLRISQTLWQKNEGQLGFRWFHEQGLPAPFVLDEIKVEVTETLTHDILELRLKAAQCDGRLRHETDAALTRDAFDAKALHVRLILRDRLVACGRLVFLSGDRRRSEIDEALVHLPDDVIQDPHAVEIARICTHPDFRRGHLLIFLLAECAWQASMRGGRRLLGYCVPQLVPIYTRFAGELLPYSGWHPLYEGRQSFVVRIDLDRVMRGEDVPFLAWARFIAPRLSEAPPAIARDWFLRAKSQGVRLLQPCLDEVWKLMLPHSA